MFKFFNGLFDDKYKRLGYKSKKDYLQRLSNSYDIPLKDVKMIVKLHTHNSEALHTILRAWKDVMRS